MRKDVFLSATVDPESASILQELAEREAEGNRSLALRRVIREAGARRGLWPVGLESAEKAVRHVATAA